MLVVSNISVTYGRGNVIENLSLEFQPNKIYSIIGPSGCGKTTLFKSITGIIRPYKGQIYCEQSDQLSIMMQNDVLLPWRTVKDNIKLGTELTTKKNLPDEQIKVMLEEFGIPDSFELYPQELSAGMKQRVSLIQAMISNPSYLFLDEPFSNLDYDIKLVIQKKLIDNHFKRKNTIVLITHDIEDAIALSDYIIILTNQPTTLKRIIPIEYDEDVRRDPVLMRTNEKTPHYFNSIWKDLKYFDA